MPRKTPAPAPAAAVPSPESIEVGSLDQRIAAAIDAAKAAGLASGYIVAVLHAHALKQTQMLLG